MSERLDRPAASAPSTPSRPSAGPDGAGLASRVGASPDWTAQTADKIEQLVGMVRANTVDRAVKVARLVVFGLLAGIMAAMAALLLVAALVRLLDVVLPRGVWLPYLIMGILFVVVGSVLWAKKAPRPQAAPAGRQAAP